MTSNTKQQVKEEALLQLWSKGSLVPRLSPLRRGEPGHFITCVTSRVDTTNGINRKVTSAHALATPIFAAFDAATAFITAHLFTLVFTNRENLGKRLGVYCK